MSSPAPVYIRVKYGNDETLLCNPSCAVVNLLNSIKTRTGQPTNAVTIDLTDEGGLIQELDVHRHDNASDHLAAPATYVLVKKQRKRPDNEIDDEKPTDGDTNGDTNGPEPNGRTLGRRPSVGDGNGSNAYEYVPMLNNWKQLLPGYKLRQMAAGTRPKMVGRGNAVDVVGAAGASSVGGGRKKIGRQRSDRIKSPSPAGVKPTAGGKQPTAANGLGTNKDKTVPLAPNASNSTNGPTNRKPRETLAN